MSILSEEYEVSLGRLKDCCTLKSMVSYWIDNSYLQTIFNQKPYGFNRGDSKLNRNHAHENARRLFDMVIDSLDVEDITPSKLLKNSAPFDLMRCRL